MPIHHLRGAAACASVRKIPSPSSRVDPLVPPPHGGWGVLCGWYGAQALSVWVLDFDVKTIPSVDLWIARFGPIPRTLTLRTPSGGRHYYYRIPSAESPAAQLRNAQNLWGLGVDVRAWHGFAAQGDGYEVIDDHPVVEAPPELVAQILASQREARDADDGPDPVSPAMGAVYGRAMSIAAQIVEEREPAQTGGRDRALFALVASLVELCNLGEAEAVAFAHMYNARSSDPLPHEEVEEKAPRAWANARRTCLLPWGPFEPPPPLVSKKAPAPPPAPLPAPPVAPFAGAPPEVAYTEQGTPKKRDALPHELIGALAYDPRWCGGGAWVWDEVHAAPAYIGEPPIPLDCRADGDVSSPKVWGPSPRDVFAIRAWLGETYAMKARPADVEAAIAEVAQRRRWNPLRTYLEGLRGLHEPLDLEAWAREAMALESAVEAQAVAKWLISAVARAMRPGEEVHQVLILWGDQRNRKSKFFRSLFGAKWSKDSPINDFTHRDAMILLRGFWCVEFAEMQAVLRSDPAVVKAYLTQAFDDFRAVGGSALIRQHRTAVFGGTSNDRVLLRDPTGDRRYWPVHVRRQIDADGIAAMRDRIWAAALARYDAGEAWFWEKEPEEYREIKGSLTEADPWTEAIAAWLLGCGRESVTLSEVVGGAVFPLGAGSIDRQDGRTSARAKSILMRLGLEERRATRRDRRRLWELSPDAIANCAAAIGKTPAPEMPPAAALAALGAAIGARDPR